MLIKVNPQGKPQNIKTEKVVNLILNTKNSQEIFKILVLNLKLNLILLLTRGLDKIYLVVK